ncbi:unannotated protein [freshwater metagenome]|uniref:Unannotated protein n=1 Tax=freshwater metagenome TaxID=449393 RepID=A0A6J7P5I5_9ZZZZ
MACGAVHAGLARAQDLGRRLHLLKGRDRHLPAAQQRHGHTVLHGAHVVAQEVLQRGDGAHELLERLRTDVDRRVDVGVDHAGEQSTERDLALGPGIGVHLGQGGRVARGQLDQQIGREEKHGAATIGGGEAQDGGADHLALVGGLHHEQGGRGHHLGRETRRGRIGQRCGDVAVATVQYQVLGVEAEHHGGDGQTDEGAREQPSAHEVGPGRKRTLGLTGPGSSRAGRRICGDHAATSRYSPRRRTMSATEGGTRPSIGSPRRTRSRMSVLETSMRGRSTSSNGQLAGGRAPTEPGRS